MRTVISGRHWRALRIVIVVALGVAGGAALSAPPAHLAILRACADADTAAQCERLLEADQIKQFADIAARNGQLLRLKSRSGAPIELKDVGTPGTDERPGFKLHAFWDYWSARNAAIVSVSAQAGDHYLIVDLNRGTQTVVPAEPLLSPDATRFVVVDLCDMQCGNVLQLWRFDRDRPVRDRTFRPSEKWFDADVRWRDADTIEIEYSVRVPSAQLPTESEPALVRARPRVLKVTDRAWSLD